MACIESFEECFRAMQELDMVSNQYKLAKKLEKSSRA